MAFIDPFGATALPPPVYADPLFAAGPAFGVPPPVAPMAPPVNVDGSPMELILQGERREAEYEWYRYSKFALPFLLLILGLGITVFWLTMWQANIDVKGYKAGVPRDFIVRQLNDDPANLTETNKNLRIAAVVFGFTSVLLILLTIYLRPPATARKGLYFLWAVLLITCSVLAWIAFGMDVHDKDDILICRVREQGNLAPAARAFHQNICNNREAVVIATAVFDGLLGFIAAVAALLLVFAALKTGKATDLDDFDAAYAAPRRIGVGAATRRLLLLALAGVVAAAVVVTIMTIILEDGADRLDADTVYGVREFTNRPPGWPVKNSRLRIATSSIAVILVLITLIPFRSRIIAYVLAFLLFLDAILSIFAFSLDVEHVEAARDLDCPDNFECKHDRFIVLCIFDILLAFFILVYILMEFIFRIAAAVTGPSKVLY